MLSLACSSARRQDACEVPNMDKIAPSPHQLHHQVQGQSRQGQSRQGQSRQGQSRQGQSRKTNGLAPLSFDLSFDLSLSLRIFVDWISFPVSVSYASVWCLSGREDSSNYVGSCGRGEKFKK